MSALAAVLLSACWQPDFCVQGLQTGARYRVTIIEPHTPESRFWGGRARAEGNYCGHADLPVGSYIDVQLTKVIVDTACKLHLAVPDSLPGMEIEGKAPMEYLRYSRVADFPAYNVRKGACAGRWDGGLEAQNSPYSTPIGPSESGQFPRVTLGRLFFPSSDYEACRAEGFVLDGDYCADLFVVEMNPL